MCTCYDNEAERLHAESNIYKNRLPARGNGARNQYRTAGASERSQGYSVKGKPQSGVGSTSPYSYQNQNTFTSTKKSNVPMNFDGGSMPTRYDSRGQPLSMNSPQDMHNNYSRPVPQGQFMDDDNAWQYSTPNNNYLGSRQPSANQWGQNLNMPPLHRQTTEQPDRRPQRGKYNNFMNDSENMMGGPSPMQNQNPSFDQQMYTGL